MNTETDEEAASLARERVVQKLFRLYRSMDGKATPALIKVYLEPIEAYDPSAAQEAYQRFRDGEVDGQSLEFIPNVPRWVSQVKMLDGLLKRSTLRGDGLIGYRIGEQPPPGTVPLGPIKGDFGEGVIDMTNLSPADKEYVMEHKKLPPPDNPLSIEGQPFAMPKLRGMM